MLEPGEATCWLLKETAQLATEAPAKVFTETNGPLNNMRLSFLVSGRKVATEVSRNLFAKKAWVDLGMNKFSNLAYG